MGNTLTAQSAGSDEAQGVLLSGCTICLVHRGRLQYASRLLQEIAGLQAAGANVILFTRLADDPGAPAGVDVVVAIPRVLAESGSSWRPLRIVTNLIRNAFRTRVSESSVDRQLTQLLRDRSADLLWTVDWPMLRRYEKIARQLGVPVLYETLDLYPEQMQLSDADRARELALEAKAVARVAGFVTAGDCYADYYVERYAGEGLLRRPVVRDNSPDTRVETTRPASRPVKLLFLGALTINRNLPNLIQAMAETDADVTLTLQGENRLGDVLAAQIDRLDLGDRVFLRDPVDPGALLETAASFDVGIVSLEPVSLNERLAPTTKLFTYMSAGLAVIGSDLPGLRSVIEKHDIGWLVPSTEPSGWARAFDVVGATPLERIDTYKRRSLEASEQYSWERQRPQYLAEFDRAMVASRIRGRSAEVGNG